MSKPDMFTWTEDLEIDKGQIDADHKQLIDIANEVACIEDLENQGEDLRRAIRKLYKYVKEHFTREEAFMLALEYSDREAHKLKHVEITGMMNETLTSSHHLSEMRDKFCEIMQHWVLVHISQEDKKINRFLYH